MLHKTTKQFQRLILDSIHQEIGRLLEKMEISQN